MGNSSSNHSQDLTDRIVFPKYTAIDDIEPPIKPQDPKKQIIDKEHITISKIFKISLEESDKFLYLEFYLAQLLSLNSEPKFRIKNLDDIIMSLLSTERKETILDYLFDTFHRAIEMIEKRFKHEYTSEYKIIHRLISNYICLLLNAPENLGIDLPYNKAYESFNKYVKTIDADELGFLLFDFYQSTCTDYDYMQKVFSFFFKYIDESNILSKPSFFNRDVISKNMYILKHLFMRFPKTAKVYMEGVTRLKESNPKKFQVIDPLSMYINIIPHESEMNLIRQNVNFSKPKKDLDKITMSNTQKLNEYLQEASEFFTQIYLADSSSQEKLLSWLYYLISINMGKLKMYHDERKFASNFYFLNLILILLKIFFGEQDQIKNSFIYSKFIFNLVSEIDPLFTITKYKIDFTKFDRTNPEMVNEILKDEESLQDLIPKKTNINSEIFFILHVLFTFSLAGIQKSIFMIQNKISEGKNNPNPEPGYNDLKYLQHCFLYYLKNKDMYRLFLQFSEATTFFIFSLNNKKYSQQEFKNNNQKIEDCINYKEFLDDFYYHINFNDNFTISLMPENVYKNLITISLFIRNFEPNELMVYLYSTKAIVYFSLIFSCHDNLIKNPHFRMEIFDIMVHLFVIFKYEENTKITQIFSLLREKFIKDSLMVSIMRVFVDAERLGTSNQFYEKFSVRDKILLLIENINKGAGQLFVENIKTYANKYTEESTKMVTMLMSDITYFNDEIIEKLSLIKQYEDLVDNQEEFNKKSEEQRKFEEEKFKNNDRIVRAEIRLFNSSLKFLVSISKVIQEKFLDDKSKLCENLANLLNYSLDVFITPRGNQLKVKNLSQYQFDPKFVLVSILSTYASFVDYKKFIEYVVKDQRSYKIENFIRARSIVEESGKFNMSKDDFEKFVSLIDKIKIVEEEIKKTIINYDDAPNEFYDPITTELMLDPVELPISKVIVDRKTIETQLLTNPIDPFNRTHLTKEMLIPCTDLKKKIDEYIAKKKGK